MPETQDPLTAAAEAIGLHTTPGAQASAKENEARKPSTPGGEAAAKENDSPKPSRKEWSDADRRAARFMLDRYKAPNRDAEDLSDSDIEFGLELGRMQEGIDAKTKRAKEQESTLQKQIDELKAQLDGKSSGDRKSNSLKEAGDMLTKAVEEGDSSQIGPALEKLAAAFDQKESAPAQAGPSAEVEDMLVESARTQLEQDWPALRNEGIFDEVRDIANGLEGRGKYADMRAASSRIARLRDAAAFVLGAPDSKQTPTNPPGRSVPRPDGHPEPAATAPKDPMAAARKVLSDRGLR